MQDRYAGDIGDFAKLALIRALGADLKVGVAWYLFPDEGHNNDGRHTGYLDQAEKWRDLDPPLFDSLNRVVKAGVRTVTALEQAALFGQVRYVGDRLECMSPSSRVRSEWREGWFQSQLEQLAGRELVFADPDNGLCENNQFKAGRRTDWKRIPLEEVQRLCAGRTGVIYHHNTRRPGGHAEEIRHWLSRLGGSQLAIRWRPYSPRTFFIVNPTRMIRDRARLFAYRWATHVDLFESP